MSNDDPFGRDGTGGDWGSPPNDDNIDMNYGQPLPPPQQQGQPGPMTGQPQHHLQPTKPKIDNNDVGALIVSVFLPGVGHMMLGQTVKGIAILVGSVVTCGGFGLLWIAVLLDVYLVAMTRKYRQLGEWEIFPDMNQHLKS